MRGEYSRQDVYDISIHAPREGSDAVLQAIAASMQQISIHAPREGSDYATRRFKYIISNFNPRSP